MLLLPRHTRSLPATGPVGALLKQLSVTGNDSRSFTTKP